MTEKIILRKRSVIIKKEKIKKILPVLSGFIAGIINGLVGAGGGTVIVPMLKLSGMDEKKSHAMSVAVILPICLVSAIFYMTSGFVSLSDVFPYFIPVLSGSVLGAVILPKCNSKILKFSFGAIMIYSGIRLLRGA